LTRAPLQAARRALPDPTRRSISLVSRYRIACSSRRIELLEFVRGTKIESSQAQSIMDVANHKCEVWRIM
jgi:hypothetical protein